MPALSGWFPGAIRDPGKNAGYRLGRVAHKVAVLHFTVGRDSRSLIRTQGLAQFLFPKVGQPFQFAEADAVCAHACEWNRGGPGLEFERLSWAEPLTPDQIRWGGAVIAWLHSTYGYPLTFHDGVRLPIGSPFRGFANHGSLVHKACDQHTDGVTQAEWSAMTQEADVLTSDQAFQLAGLDLGNPTSPLNKRLDGITASIAALNKRLDEMEGKPSVTVIDALKKLFPMRAGRV